jgi:hypothetical protein
MSHAYVDVDYAKSVLSELDSDGGDQDEGMNDGGTTDADGAGDHTTWCLALLGGWAVRAW